MNHVASVGDHVLPVVKIVGLSVDSSKVDHFAAIDANSHFRTLKVHLLIDYDLSTDHLPCLVTGRTEKNLDLSVVPLFECLFLLFCEGLVLFDLFLVWVLVFSIGARETFVHLHI